MSLTTTGKYSLSVINPASVTVPWLSSQCSISEAPIEQQTSDQIPGGQRTSTVCATTCSNNDFTLRADGMCKNQYKALVALVDDGLPPLCDSAKPVLANFITCGLKHLLPSLKHADFHPPSVKVKFDTRLNRTLDDDKGDKYKSLYTLMCSEDVGRERDEAMIKALSDSKCFDPPQDIENDMKRNGPLSRPLVGVVWWACLLAATLFAHLHSEM
ncbi:hypothetical protein RRG08_007299 [Elysia crispata]|uniref:Uncharacterized protein n=1 Tax=Elysia crispata TaxID=231223 RepID=A0AAE1E6T8_9GAST|nr:hypothetical protein RRG08_007299 [Elysia crispata]